VKASVNRTQIRIIFANTADSRLSGVDWKLSYPDNQQKKYVSNFYIGIYKTTGTFIICSTTTCRKMIVVSQKLLCRFCTLKRKAKQRKPS
jgi:hypothetical protein